MKNPRLLMLFVLTVAVCTKSVLTAGYYRLLEKERKLYIVLRSIDSVAATKYLNLPSPTERKYFYDQYWQGNEHEKEVFEERAAYALKEFGRYAPLTDERIPVYVKYGKPNRRYAIAPERKVGIISREYVRPAEIWTYNDKGIEFDFVRLTRAYHIINTSYFGDSVFMPYLREDTSSVQDETLGKTEGLKFDISFGRFRQKKNLVRLEIYSGVFIDDTFNCRILRSIQIRDKADSLVMEKKNILIPVNGDKGIFYDEINVWQPPQKFFVTLEYHNLKNGKSGTKKFSVDLLDYKDDAKKISDLLFAKLIDDAEVDEKFSKPTGRIIPLVNPSLPVSVPFYIYHEVYNLTTKEGQHLLKIDYEVYNKEKMRKEVVDIMTQTESSDGDVAYIAAKYHPMDLPAGTYIIVVRDTDLLSGEQFTAVGEFILEKAK